MICDCGHESLDEPGYVCEHLRGTEDNDYFRWYTGQGRTYRVCCKRCANLDSQELIPWKSVCEACFEHVETSNGQTGVRGTPEILLQPSNLAFSHRVISGEFFSDPLRLVVPIIGASGSVWIALTMGGSLVELTFVEEATAPTRSLLCRQITTITPDDLSLAAGVSLTCSADGKVACLTETLGSAGAVIETSEGRRTMRLSRDGYHNDVTPFSAAFVNWNDRTLLIHGGAWNRLDISDPLSGEVLTERSPTSYGKGEPRPAHYLDYFHGRLLASPEGRFIADDGWVWHPVGIVRTWNVQTWLEENRWESEDGLSVRDFLGRAYFWGGPMCWLDATTLAIWGYGDDDENLVPAVHVFDVVTGEERNLFFGPEVAPLGEPDWRAKFNGFGGRLIFDRYLFAVSGKYGVGIWDVDSGARQHQDASFAPVAYHTRTKDFLTLLPDGSVQLSRFVDPEAPAQRPHINR